MSDIRWRLKTLAERHGFDVDEGARVEDIRAAIGALWNGPQILATLDAMDGPSWHQSVPGRMTFSVLEKD